MVQGWILGSAAEWRVPCSATAAMRGERPCRTPPWRLDRALLDVWSLCEARVRDREGGHANGVGFGELTVLKWRSTVRTMLG